jgi:hypothetical protein
MGRQYQTRVVNDLEASKYNTSTGVYQYRDPLPKPNLANMSGVADLVMEINHQDFDTAGNVTRQHHFEQNHGSTCGIVLTTNPTNNYVRETSYLWYDDADRVRTRGYHGSGDSGGLWRYAALPGTDPTEPSASSSSMLVTKYAYSPDRGLLEKVTDPNGIISATFYDDLGSTKFSVENFNIFNPSGSGSNTGGTDMSVDRAVRRVYNGLGGIVQLIALDRNGDNDQSDNELTQYEFKDVNDASLNTKVTYPDNRGQETRTYTLDGRPATMTDQRGEVMTYSYTTYRELEREAATTVPVGVDASVRSILREFDELRRLDKVTPYSGTSGGTVLNQIDFDYYHGLYRVEYAYRDHDAVVVKGSSPQVRFGFDEAVDGGGIATNGLRQNYVQHPSSKKITSYFDTPIDDVLHRVSRINSDVTGTATNIATYYYSGTARLVDTTYSVPGVYSRLDLSGSGDGTYEFLDRFGRITTKEWRVGATIKDQVVYTYDYAGNRLSRDIPASLTNGLDQIYAYDGSHRLKNFDEGTIGGSIVSEQVWTLDAWGNWTKLDEKTSGAATLNQTRGHNNANEITSIGIAVPGVGDNWYDPTYDSAGNLATGPKPGAPKDNDANGRKLKYTWDAWNRLKIVEQSPTNTTTWTQIATYQYDGLRRRIVKTASGLTDHYYYNNNWQCVEVRRRHGVGEQSRAICMASALRRRVSGSLL